MGFNLGFKGLMYLFPRSACMLLKTNFPEIIVIFLLLLFPHKLLDPDRHFHIENGF